MLLTLVKVFLLMFDTASFNSKGGGVTGGGGLFFIIIFVVVVVVLANFIGL